MKAVFDHVQQETDTIHTYWFQPEQPLRFTAGQFTELTLHHKNPDARGDRRWFTISSSPTDSLVSITTRTQHDGSTFKDALHRLQSGDHVELAEAMGDFVLPKLVQTPLIFIAGGIGITPFHSIAAWLTATEETRDIRLLHAVRTEDDIIFGDTFSSAGIEPTIVVSEPSASWGGVRGRLTAELALGLEKPSDDTLIYLSGPEPMLEALKADLQKHGVDSRQIVTDFFPGYPSL